MKKQDKHRSEQHQHKEPSSSHKTRYRKPKLRRVEVVSHTVWLLMKFVLFCSCFSWKKPCKALGAACGTCTTYNFTSDILLLVTTCC